MRSRCSDTDIDPVQSEFQKINAFNLPDTGNVETIYVDESIKKKEQSKTKTSNKVWFNVAFITQRFLTQVNNHFPIPMDLFCKKEDQLSRVTTIEPDSVFSVPLILAHKAALYLRPAGFGFVYFTVICALTMTVCNQFIGRSIELFIAMRSNFARSYLPSIL